jgi:probable rRNA maturation factor
MIDVEVFGATAAAPPEREIRALCAEAAARRGVEDGHVAIAFVDARRIAELNGEHRGKPVPTDVLSFPIDGIDGAAGEDREMPGPPRELGDIVICPEHTEDLREAVVHGMLHLLGMDHEHDDGEMLSLQARVLDGGRA